jgi:hypothetical protein
LKNLVKKQFALRFGLIMVSNCILRPLTAHHYNPATHLKEFNPIAWFLCKKGYLVSIAAMALNLLLASSSSVS